MSVAATKKPRAKKAANNGKPKQKHIPGMEPPSIPKIDRLAEKYDEAKQAWMRLKQPMIDAQDLLYAAMKEANLQRYEFGNKVVLIDHTEKVKVNPKGKDEE